MNTALVTALAGALLHFIWQGAGLAVLLALALLVSHNARTRYAIACAALFAMPIVFVMTLLVVYPAPASLVTQSHASQTFPSTFGSARFLMPTSAPLGTAQRLMRAFVPFWFAGIALLYLRAALSWIALRNVRQAALASVATEWRERLSALSERLQISRFVDLCESKAVDVPVVAGFIRPLILFPAGCLSNMPVEQVEYLLIHELAHIRRRDYVVNLIQKAIEGLLFYHPAVWWISGMIRREREHCCDDVVLSLHPEPREYARTLAHLEQTRWTAVPAANGGDLNTRIRRVLGLSTTQHVAPAAVLSLALASAAVFLTVATLPRSARAQDFPSDTAFRRWVQEEIPYIITNAERAALNKAATNEDRKHFVEEFWLRRDPTPGTPENEYKEEHYRRLAYVNQKFASSVPGWKTDRGRIYIIFGPPDEIDSHPSCAPNEPPHEEWKYQWIEGIGRAVVLEFRDPTCKGEYLMTMDPAHIPQRDRP